MAKNNLIDVDGKLAKAGIKIKAPGLSGSAEYLGDQLKLRTPGGQLFHNALANSGLSATTHIALGHSSAPTDQVKITVPKRTPRSNALLLIHDSTGALSWHAPDDIGLASLPKVQLPPSSVASFTVPAERFAAGNQHAGLLSRIAGLAEHFHLHPGLGPVTKVLSVVEYPVEHLVGELGSKWFADWENNKHPSVVRWFPAEGDLTVGEALSPTNWHQLAEGPTLLFVHGIFSSCESGFAGISHDDSTWPKLRQRYGNRIIGFDHPTGSVSPAANAEWFLNQIPEKVQLDLDIVCHSRGGLVARSIAAQSGTSVNIRRIVFAATPNGGSQITMTQNWVSMINRISSVLTLPAKVLPAPADAISGVLAGLLEVLKIVAVGVALDLPGLEAMTPGCQFLQELAQAPDLTPKPEYFAASADFEPGPVLANLFNRLDAEGRVVDSAVFDGAHNDIAVPTDGVWDPASVKGAVTPVPGFPIDPERRLTIGPGSVYWHCDYFDDSAMRAALLEWLPGS